jgi:hypothetical protein
MVDASGRHRGRHCQVSGFVQLFPFERFFLVAGKCMCHEDGIVVTGEYGAAMRAQYFSAFDTGGEICTELVDLEWSPTSNGGAPANLHDRSWRDRRCQALKKRHIILNPKVFINSGAQLQQVR